MSKGKKSKKSKSLLKQFKPLLSNNRMLLSVLGGALAGVALASLMNSDKGREMMDRFGNVARDFTDRLTGNDRIVDPTA